MAKMTKFRRGDVVRVVGERRTSKVRAILTHVNGALLETEIGGFRSWNLDELRLVKRAESPANGRRDEETRAKLIARARLRWGKKVTDLPAKPKKPNSL